MCTISSVVCRILNYDEFLCFCCCLFCCCCWHCIHIGCSYAQWSMTSERCAFRTRIKLHLHYQFALDHNPHLRPSETNKTTWTTISDDEKKTQQFSKVNNNKNGIRQYVRTKFVVRGKNSNNNTKRRLKEHHGTYSARQRPTTNGLIFLFLFGHFFFSYEEM